MSNRETFIENEIHSWKGVDQRSQPTLVPSGYVTNARGCLFGSGESERIPGKQLAGKLSDPIFHLYNFQEITFVQTFDTLYIVPTLELLNFNVENTFGFVLDENGIIVLDEDDESIEDDA